MPFQDESLSGTPLLKGRHIRFVSSPEWDPIHSSRQTAKLGFIFSEWFDFPVTPLYLNQEYLQQKYVAENLSADEVASEIGCAVSTVLKHLRKYGIPVRESGQNIRPKRHLPFIEVFKDKDGKRRGWDGYAKAIEA